MADNKKENDIFAAPSQEEIDMFSAPTQSELGVKQELSIPEAMLEGASQGATFGFAEEITAPFVAAAGMATGSPRLPEESRMQQLQRLMQIYRDVARERTKQAEEESPVAFTGGAIIGGAAIPGLAAAKAPNLITQIAKSAGIGAIGGGISGLGMAEGTLPERIPAALDMAETGTLIGAVIPGGIAAGKGVIKGTKAAAKALKESDIGKIYSAYARGEDLLSDVVSNFEKLKDVGGKATQKLTETYSKLRENLNQQFKQLDESGLKVEVAPILEENRKRLIELSNSQNPDIAKNAKKVLDVVDNYLYGKEQVKLVPKVSQAEKQLKDYEKTLKAYNKLQQKQLKEGLTDQEEIALNKLLGKKAELEATQGFQGLDMPGEFMSPEGKKVLTQEIGKEVGGEAVTKTLGQQVKGIELTPISSSIDPVSGNKILSFKNMETGEVFSEMIPPDMEVSTALKAIKVRAGADTKLSPSELRKAEEAFKSFTPIEGMDLPGPVKGVTGDIVKGLKGKAPEEIQKSLDNISQILTKFEQLTGKSLKDINVQLPATQTQMREKLGQELLSLDPKSLEKGKLPAVFEGFESPITKGKQIPGMRQVAPEALEILEKEAPELAEKIRLGYKMLPQDIKTIAPDVRAQLAAKFGGGLGLLTQATALAGKTAALTGKTMGEFTRNFIEKDPVYLATMAKKISQIKTPVAEQVSRVLQKAQDPEITNRSKNALLFGLMQNPEYRELIRQQSESMVDNGSE